MSRMRMLGGAGLAFGGTTGEGAAPIIGGATPTIVPFSLFGMRGRTPASDGGVAAAGVAAGGAGATGAAGGAKPPGPPRFGVSPMSIVPRYLGGAAP